MKYFLRIAAVLVALGNWCALMTGGDLSRLANYDRAEWLTFFLLPTALGLASAEVALRHAAKALRGGFLDRYAAMAATVWMGGMLCGVALASGGVLRDEALGIGGTVGFGAVASLWGIVCGGALGLAEGLVLGLPLAAVLGAFGKANGSEVLPGEVRVPDTQRRSGPWSAT
jgi:hypothetical protein